MACFFLPCIFFKVYSFNNFTKKKPLKQWFLKYGSRWVNKWSAIKWIKSSKTTWFVFTFCDEINISRFARKITELWWNLQKIKIGRWLFFLMLFWIFNRRSRILRFCWRFYSDVWYLGCEAIIKLRFGSCSKKFKNHRTKTTLLNRKLLSLLQLRF